MKYLILVILFLTAFYNPSFPREDEAGKPPSILRNWAAVQAGELGGWGATALIFRALDGLGAFHSEEQKEDGFIVSGVIIGHLSGNFLLKHEARQTTPVFLKNLAFSALPVVVYAIFREPKIVGDNTFLGEEGEKVDFVLISMFVTPIFATIGNEIFNCEQYQHDSKKESRIQPYGSIKDSDYEVGILIRF